MEWNGRAYSINRGISFERDSVTVLDNPEALQKLTRYLSEKVSATGSCRSMMVASSGFSTLAFCRKVTAPLPMSPWQENLIPSLVASIETTPFYQTLTHVQAQTPQLTRFRNRTQVPANPLELCAGQGDGSAIVGLGDTEVLLVDVHELDIILADTVVLGVFEDQAEHVRRVLRLQRQGIIALRRTQHLLQTAQVDSQRDVPVASELREALRLQMHRHQRDVRVVHRLQRNSRIIAVKVAILDQVLDGIDDLDSNNHC
jgi:hypothetical protein